MDNPPCPCHGKPGIEICLGCKRPTESERDCGCPAGVGYICSVRKEK